MCEDNDRCVRIIVCMGGDWSFLYHLCERSRIWYEYCRLTINQWWIKRWMYRDLGFSIEWLKFFELLGIWISAHKWSGICFSTDASLKCVDCLSQGNFELSAQYGRFDTVLISETAVMDVKRHFLLDVRVYDVRKEMLDARMSSIKKESVRDWLLQ